MLVYYDQWKFSSISMNVNIDYLVITRYNLIWTQIKLLQKFFNVIIWQENMSTGCKWWMNKIRWSRLLKFCRSLRNVETSDDGFLSETKNSPQTLNWVPLMNSAGEKPISCLIAIWSPKRTVVRIGTQFEFSWHIILVLIDRCHLSIKPLDCGLYAVVQHRLIPRRLAMELKKMDLNCLPWSVVTVHAQYLCSLKARQIFSRCFDWSHDYWSVMSSEIFEKPCANSAVQMVW